MADAGVAHAGLLRPPLRLANRSSLGLASKDEDGDDTFGYVLQWYARGLPLPRAPQRR